MHKKGGSMMKEELSEEELLKERKNLYDQEYEIKKELKDIEEEYDDTKICMQSDKTLQVDILSHMTGSKYINDIYRIDDEINNGYQEYLNTLQQNSEELSKELKSVTSKIEEIEKRLKDTKEEE